MPKAIFYWRLSKELIQRSILLWYNSTMREKVFLEIEGDFHGGRHFLLGGFKRGHLRTKVSCEQRNADRFL